MEKKVALQGILPVLSTPILKDGSIDEDGLRRLVGFLLGKGVAGFWALGTSSEDMNLSFEKRIQVARIVSETTAGQVPVLLGAASYALEDIMAFIRETSALDISGFHVMVYHPLLGLDRVEWLYRFVADHSPKPLWLYSSANYGRWLPPEFVARIKDHPNIDGVKYSTSNAVHAAKVTMLADDDFQVITSVAGTLLAALSIGSKAHTTSIASCFPEILIGIYQLFQEGKMAEALSEQRRLLRFLDGLRKDFGGQLFSGGRGEIYPFPSGNMSRVHDILLQGFG